MERGPLRNSSLVALVDCELYESGAGLSLGGALDEDQACVFVRARACACVHVRVCVHACACMHACVYPIAQMSNPISM